jgi:hypothetical protein
VIYSVYLAPQAAFVFRNWERTHEVIKDVHDAIRTATFVSLLGFHIFALGTGLPPQNIINSNFIDEADKAIDVLQEEKGNLFDGLVNKVLDLIFGNIFTQKEDGEKILTAFRIFDHLVTNGEIGPEPPLEVVAANQAIEEGAERFKDQMKRQLRNTFTTL